MDDLVSRQAVKDGMIKYGFVAPDMDVYEFVEDELPSIQLITEKWIPVSERLPEKNVWVLVTVVQGSGWYVETMRIDKYKGMFTDNIDYYDSVIAWMPLPKPYKAESEG